MFNILKWFTPTVETREGVREEVKPGYITTGESEMARIDDDNNLFGPMGEFIASYSRRRDAVRGAKRRGLAVA